MEIIDIHTAIKIAEAQKNKLEEIQVLCNLEISHIKESFQKILSEQLKNILEDPFKNYVVIPQKNYDTINNHKLFIDTFKDCYLKAFGHALHVNKEGYLFLIKSGKFLNHQEDPRPLDISKTGVESPADDEAPSLLFTQNEMKRFADREMSSTKVAPSKVDPKNATELKKTPMSARREPRLSVESQLVPLFLQRRLSKTIPPSLDSSREPSVNS
jgi:hypothetical protein